VEAEQKEAPETAELVVDLLEPLHHRAWRADDPVVPGTVLRRHVAVWNVGRVLQELQKTEIAKQAEVILAIHPFHHAAQGTPPRFGVTVGDEDPANDPPVTTAGLAAAALSAELDGLPVARDIGRIEVEAHRDESALAGELQSIGVLRQTGHPHPPIPFLHKPHIP